MKNINNEQCLLAILLLLLTSISTISGSMPTIHSIETYFENKRPRDLEMPPMPRDLKVPPRPPRDLKVPPRPPRDLKVPPRPPRDLKVPPMPPRDLDLIDPNMEPPIIEKFGVNPGTDPQGGISLGAAYGLDKKDIKEFSEEFHSHKKNEHFNAHHKKNEHFNAHHKKNEHFNAHHKKNVIEPFQGCLYANV
jgi:hypothetical protein